MEGYVMKHLAIVALCLSSISCATNSPKTAPTYAKLEFVQLYLFNQSGKTVDLRVALDDSVLYYAQIQSIATPGEISGGRLVQRAPGLYHLVLNDFTHGQQIARDVPVSDSTVYVVVRTRETGSEVDVSLARPF
jgi:hypothetical protein